MIDEGTIESNQNYFKALEKISFTFGLLRHTSMLMVVPALNLNDVDSVAYI